MMRPLFNTPALRRATAGRAIHLVDHALAVGAVTRARELPEEARVRLLRQLADHFEREQEKDWQRRMRGGAWRRFTAWLADVCELWRQALLS
jgi:hypothetical protein